MAIVDLDDREWQQVVALLADAPWKIANPLLTRIAGQLQAQAQQAPYWANPQTDRKITPDNPPNVPPREPSQVSANNSEEFHDYRKF
jgi:hypothetical protein